MFVFIPPVFQILANGVLYFCVNVAGLFIHNVTERAQRKTFIKTRNCIASRLDIEDENEKLVSNYFLKLNIITITYPLSPYDCFLPCLSSLRLVFNFLFFSLTLFVSPLQAGWERWGSRLRPLSVCLSVRSISPSHFNVLFAWLNTRIPWNALVSPPIYFFPKWYLSSLLPFFLYSPLRVFCVLYFNPHLPSWPRASMFCPYILTSVQEPFIILGIYTVRTLRLRNKFKGHSMTGAIVSAPRKPSLSSLIKKGGKKAYYARRT